MADDEDTQGTAHQRAWDLIQEAEQDYDRATAPALQADDRVVAGHLARSQAASMLAVAYLEWARDLPTKPRLLTDEMRERLRGRGGRPQTPRNPARGRPQG